MEDTDSDGPVSRRGFLRAAAGTAAVAGASGTAAAQEGGGSGGGGSTPTVTVGPGGNLTFEPAELSIAPGTAVKFVWGSGGHNVVPESGDWGHTSIEDEGFSYTTPPFQQTGEMGYYCAPHQSAGMTGTIIVGSTGGGGGSSEPSIPSSAKTLGIAAMSFMLSTLGLAYFFMRYGGDYGDVVEE